MPPFAHIDALDHQGRGIARIAGKAVFIDGALPHEDIDYTITQVHRRYEQGALNAIRHPSPWRVTPRCAHFNHCGGCSMQHLDHDAQVAIKQRALEDALWHIGKVRAECLAPPIAGQAWRYRFRGRLAVRHHADSGTFDIGFHRAQSHEVVNLQHCPVLPQAIETLLGPLHALLKHLHNGTKIPYIEFALGEKVIALLLRTPAPLCQQDQTILHQFASQRQIQLWLQPRSNAQSAQCFYAASTEPLRYRIPEFSVTLAFRPTDFTQVNALGNQLLVRRALQWLAPQREERIADFFCGLGNFTLPIARSGAHVVGLEGSDALVERARHNAQDNQLGHYCEFHALDLFDMTEDSLAAMGHFDRMLIDPPRDGAHALVKAINPVAKPKCIVYVSCNPATLARDAAILVQHKGYRLKLATAVNLFTHTAHVESIAQFIADDPATA